MEHDIVEAKLQAPQDFSVCDGIERAVRQHRQIGGGVFEDTRIDVDPDSKDSILAEGHHRLRRSGNCHDKIVAAGPRPRSLVLLDPADPDGRVLPPGVAIDDLIDASMKVLRGPAAGDRAMDGIRARFGTTSLTRAAMLGRDPGIAVPLLPD